MAWRPSAVAEKATAAELTLVDTSAWIEFLRATGSSVHMRVRSLIQTGSRLATTEPIVMEVLAGARDHDHSQRLRRLVLACELLPIDGLADYEQAAALYRSCRETGATVRTLIDCLIAAVAIRWDVRLLHADADFDLIARNSKLRIAAGRPT